MIERVGVIVFSGKVGRHGVNTANHYDIKRFLCEERCAMEAKVLTRKEKI